MHPVTVIPGRVPTHLDVLLAASAIRACFARRALTHGVVGGMIFGSFVSGGQVGSGASGRQVRDFEWRAVHSQLLTAEVTPASEKLPVLKRNTRIRGTGMYCASKSLLMEFMSESDSQTDKDELKCEAANTY